MIEGSPSKRNGTDIDGRQTEGKKIRIGSGGTSILSSGSVTITERRNKSNNNPVLQSNILLVDMNGEESFGKIKDQTLDSSSGPLDSPLGKQIATKTEVKIIESKIEPNATKIVKRLTRDVNHSKLMWIFRQITCNFFFFRNWNAWCWSKCAWPSVNGVSLVSSNVD